MENEMDDLKAIWKNAKGSAPVTNISTDWLIQQAQSKKKQALLAHYGNIAVLSVLVIILAACFYFFFPFRDTLSRSGVALMIGGVLIRIGIEVFSVIKSNKVNVSDTTAQATDDTLAFYEFRKKIHGPVTLTIVLLYIIGFYMLSPEFSRYIPFTTLMAFDISFLVCGIVLTWFIRRGIRRELEDLRAVVELRKQLLAGA